MSTSGYVTLNDFNSEFTLDKLIINSFILDEAFKFNNESNIDIFVNQIRF